MPKRLILREAYPDIPLKGKSYKSFEELQNSIQDLKYLADENPSADFQEMVSTVRGELTDSARFGKISPVDFTTLRRFLDDVIAEQGETS